MIKLLLQIVTLFCGWLPRKWCLGFGRWLGRLVFSRLKVRTQVAIDNLELIYRNQLSPQERIHLARENFAHLGGSFFEILHIASQPQRLNSIVRIEGEQYLLQALAQHKRAVLFSAHFGAFYLLGTLMRKYCNIQFILRQPSHSSVVKAYQWFLQQLNLVVIADNPRETCALKAFKHLLSGGVIGFLIDQVETGGIYVDFMGQPAGSTTGAAQLALRSRAPLLGTRIMRLPDSTHLVTIYPELKMQRHGHLESSLKAAVTEMNQMVGDWVKTEPTQWFWPHRRWRKWRK